MLDTHKKQFWTMVNVAMELTNHPPLSKEAIITWWHFLAKYELQEVETALDTWLKSMSKPPTPNDINNLCKHKVTIYAKLPSPLSKQANKEHSTEVMDYISKNIKPKTDYKAWAKRIIANPSKFPSSSLIAAKQVMGEMA